VSCETDATRLAAGGLGRLPEQIAPGVWSAVAKPGIVRLWRMWRCASGTAAPGSGSHEAAKAPRRRVCRSPKLPTAASERASARVAE